MTRRKEKLYRATNHCAVYDNDDLPKIQSKKKKNPLLYNDEEQHESCLVHMVFTYLHVEKSYCEK